MKETISQVLNRLAKEHLERRTIAYIQQLEAVAISAKRCLEIPDLENFEQAKELAEKLKALSEVA